MKTVTVNRKSDDGVETLGVLSVDDFTAFTLERPWKDNLPEISCIPAGSYTCTYNRSEHLSQEAGHDVFTYEILQVKDRVAIRIHSANSFNQLLGCIALGSAEMHLNGDVENDVINSRATVGHFVAKMLQQDFTLMITQ